MVMKAEDIPALEAEGIRQFLSCKHDWGPEYGISVALPNDDGVWRHHHMAYRRSCRSECGLALDRDEGKDPVDVELIQRLIDHVNEAGSTGVA